MLCAGGSSSSSSAYGYVGEIAAVSWLLLWIAAFGLRPSWALVTDMVGSEDKERVSTVPRLAPVLWLVPFIRVVINYWPCKLLAGYCV